MIAKKNTLYSEVYSFLVVLGEQYINKLPSKLFEHIKNEAKETITIDMDKDIYEQLSKEAITFISVLNLDYWVDENERKRLVALYKDNEIKAEMLKNEKYNPDNLFKRNNSLNYNKYNNENNMI